MKVLSKSIQASEKFSVLRWPQFATLSQIKKHPTTKKKKKRACQLNQFIATDINRERETGENNKLCGYILKVTKSNS